MIKYFIFNILFLEIIFLNQGINFKVNKVFIQTPGPEAGKIIE